jgi:hypothetical protein
LFLGIHPNSFKDREGNWYTNTADNAYMFSVLESCCQRIEYIPEIAYRYNSRVNKYKNAITMQMRKQTGEDIR